MLCGKEYVNQVKQKTEIGTQRNVYQHSLRNAYQNQRVLNRPENSSYDRLTHWVKHGQKSMWSLHLTQWGQVIQTNWELKQTV